MPLTLPKTLLRPLKLQAPRAKNVAVMNLIIPKDTDKAEAALKFALFVTNPENQLTFAKEADVLPSTTESLANPYFSEVKDGDDISQARVVSAQQMEDAEILIPAMKDIKNCRKSSMRICSRPCSIRSRWIKPSPMPRKLGIKPWGHRSEDSDLRDITNHITHA